MGIILFIYLFIGWLMAYETICTMERDDPEGMQENYRNIFWWIGPILCTIGWPVIFIWAWLDPEDEEPEW